MCYSQLYDLPGRGSCALFQRIGLCEFATSYCTSSNEFVVVHCIKLKIIWHSQPRLYCHRPRSTTYCLVMFNMLTCRSFDVIGLLFSMIITKKNIQNLSSTEMK